MAARWIVEAVAIDLHEFIASLREPNPYLEVLTELVAAREALARLERPLVEAARRQGASWLEVGAALGVTTQTAHQRHAPLRGELRR